PGAVGPTRRRGDVVFDDLVLVKEIDKASPKIAEALCKGKVYPKVEIHVTASFVDPGRVTYFAYELKNVMVTSYNVSAGTHNLFRPVEEIGLNFEELKVTYTEHDIRGQSKGNVEYSWKVEEGEP
ncbi:MAG: Hcp family type VI secretion system effector, partial [Planctomycetota bacterium]